MGKFFERIRQEKVRETAAIRQQSSYSGGEGKIMQAK